MPGTALDAGNCTQGQRQPCEDSYVRGRGPASLYVALGGAALKHQHLSPTPHPSEAGLDTDRGPHPQFLLLEVQAGA